MINIRQCRPQFLPETFNEAVICQLCFYVLLSTLFTVSKYLSCEGKQSVHCALLNSLA